MTWPTPVEKLQNIRNDIQKALSILQKTDIPLMIRLIKQNKKEIKSFSLIVNAVTNIEELSEHPHILYTKKLYDMALSDLHKRETETLPEYMKCAEELQKTIDFYDKVIEEVKKIQK